jgi:hypothetical protein
MNRPTLNTTPLFRTSLRDWQATWKARRAQASAEALLSAEVTETAQTTENEAERPIVVNVSRAGRFHTRKRRKGERKEADVASN